jgi:hypothetical protein
MALRSDQIAIVAGERGRELHDRFSNHRGLDRPTSNEQLLGGTEDSVLALDYGRK